MAKLFQSVKGEYATHIYKYNVLMSTCTSFGPGQTGYYKQLVGKLDLHNSLVATESFTQFSQAAEGN